jgi:hypothetical protein
MAGRYVGQMRRMKTALPQSSLVDVNIVDQESTRIDRLVHALLPAPVAADGEVEDQVLGLIKRPWIDAFYMNI